MSHPDALQPASPLAECSEAPAIFALLQTIAQLRDPVSGCPWDLKQTHQSLRPYILEEAYETVEAIQQVEQGQSADLLKEELGDVLLQVVLHAQLAQEAGLFDFHDICQTLNEKMIRRHPHVFGATRTLADADAVTQQWVAIKQAEKSPPTGDAQPTVLPDKPRHQPALTRAFDISQKAVAVGFEWPSEESLWQCVMSEFDELRHETEALKQGETPPLRARLESEMGDIFFACVNLSRHYHIHPEIALSHATTRFIHRFQAMETFLLQENKEITSEEALRTCMKNLSFEAWDTLWNKAKA